MVNMIMAFLDGVPEARKLVHDQLLNHSLNWSVIVGQVKWSALMFYLGPLPKGHLDGLTQNKHENPYENQAAWMDYERGTAHALFMNDDGTDLFLSSAFGESVSCKSIFTGIASVKGQPLAVTTISLDNLLLENGFPVYWKPDLANIESQLPMLCLIAGREHIRYDYVSY